MPSRWREDWKEQMASDIELLHAWHDSRDAEAFKELTRRYAGLVHAAAKRILGNEATAEDVTQESFERLATTAHPPQGPLAPWLHRVATNRAMDRVRAEQTRRRREREYADKQANGASAIAWGDVYAHVDAAVNELPDILRVPMVEHFYRDRSAADIAAEFGLTRQAVSYRIRKGVAAVRQALRKRGISTALATLTALMGTNLAEAASLPVSLTTKLGQLAVAGIVGPNLNTAATAATILGGALVMKKVVAVVAVVVVALLGIWAAPKLVVPNAEPAPPAYAPRTNTPQVVPPPAEEPKEGAFEPAPLTGDISGRFYNLITGEGVPGLRPEILAVEDGIATDRVLKVEGSDSDASGAYQLTGLEPGQYAVRAPDPDAYPRTTWGSRNTESLLIMVAANTVVRNVDFGLEPGASVRGVVVSRGGEPVEGAEVTGRPKETMLLRHAKSGPGGTFELFMPVCDNTMEVQANKDGLYSPVFASWAFSYEGLKDVVLKLTEARTGSVSGTVVDTLGLPVQGVTVTLYGGAFPLETMAEIMSPERSVKTAGKGAFWIDQLLASSYSVYLTAAGAQFDIRSASQEVAELDLRPGETLDGLRFTFVAGLSISGRVVDTSGQPLKNVYVLAKSANSPFDNPDCFSASDAEGRFVLAGLESGKYALSARRARWQNCEVPAGVFAAGSGDVQIVVADAGRVEGRVVRADTGVPLTQFQIYICESRVDRLIPRLFNAAYGGALTYEPEGRFVRRCSRGEAEDGTIAVIAMSPGFVPNYQNVHMPEDGVATGVEVRLQPSRLIKGRVIDTLGHPVAGARIGWGNVPVGRDMLRVVARSDSNGLFSAESMPGDEDVLYASHPSYAPSSARVASKMTFVLEPGGMLEGRVWAKGGGYPDVLFVSAKCPGLPYGGPFHDYPGRDGTYRIAGIPAGSIEVELHRNKVGRSIKRQTQIVSGQTTTEDFEVEGGGTTVSGQILGEGVVPEQVFLELNTSMPEGVQTLYGKGAQDGTYRIAGVAPGRAELKAKQYATPTQRGNPRQTQLVEFEIVDGNDVVQDIVFGPGCTVAGTFAGFAPGHTGVVTALEGDVDLSGLVTVQDIQAYLPEVYAIAMAQAECNPLGQYMLQGLPPGTYTLVALTVDAANNYDIAQWRWTYAVIKLDEKGETLTMDFDFR